LETKKNSQRIRVFHVDDNPDACRLMSWLLRLEPDLEEAGHRTEASGLLTELERTRPDVLVIDLTMRGEDPIEAIRAVRKALPGLRIVVLSGTSDPARLQLAREAGAAECVLKSPEIDQTLSAIRGG
jgi:DNA-binding NarL/FixJ family response regulator